MSRVPVLSSALLSSWQRSGCLAQWSGRPRASPPPRPGRPRLWWTCARPRSVPTGAREGGGSPREAYNQHTLGERYFLCSGAFLITVSHGIRRGLYCRVLALDVWIKGRFMVGKPTVAVLTVEGDAWSLGLLDTRWDAFSSEYETSARAVDIWCLRPTPTAGTSAAAWRSPSTSSSWTRRRCTKRAPGSSSSACPALGSPGARQRVWSECGSSHRAGWCVPTLSCGNTRGCGGSLARRPSPC